MTSAPPAGAARAADSAGPTPGRGPESLARRLTSAALRPARAAGFGGLTAAMLAVYEAHRRIDPARQPELLARYRARWLDVMLKLFGVDLTVLPGPPPPAHGARLVVSNHRSALDIAILLRLFGGNFLSRGDIADWPLFGAVARVGGTIFVDRGEGMSRASAARTVRRRLAEGGTVLVFPEGTTYGGDEVRPFHAGTFVAGRGLPVEVVPVGLAYEPGAEYHEDSFLEHLGATAGRRRTRVVACIGAGRPLEGETRALAVAYRDEVQTLVDAARAALESR